MIVALNKTQRDRRSSVQVRDVYVDWQTNFQDNDTSQLIVSRGADAEVRARHRPCVKPTSHTGCDFFHHLILSNILSQRLDVKVYNEDELQNGSALSEVQRKRKLRMFIENVSKDDLVYIYTDIQVGNENFVIKGGYQFKPLTIIFMRDPIEALLSSFHAHKFGEDVFKLYENQSDLYFNRRMIV
ncbi:hypothetical protein BSL78_21303 [Apostichopus japonicus]|uniref:Uncharacterized protein n=1 Tax=Stichopus japonicus TaxID=307972 RepID=A0A2G8K1H7_STIJA|nr:hypothetical protein BSL78_21303 [Apostichopus japonicus]